MKKNLNSLILKLLTILLLVNGNTAFAKSRKSNYQRLPTKKIKSVEMTSNAGKNSSDSQDNEEDAEEAEIRAPSAENKSSASPSTESGKMENLPPSVNINSYPYGNLYDSYQEEFSAEVSQKDAESRALKARSDYEENKATIEREIAQKRQRIFELKQSKEEAEAQIILMETELKSVFQQQEKTNFELAEIAKKSDEVLAAADVRKKELTETKAKLSDSMEKMTQMKDQALRNFYKARVEAERIKTDIQILETETAALSASVRNAHADELKARAEWQAVKTAAERNRSEKLKSQKSLAEAKEKLAKAMEDLRMAKQELATTEKERNDTDRVVTAEVKRMEELTANASKSKTLAEMQKAKVESEIEKIKIYGDSVKKNNIEIINAMQNSQYDLMESRISLESLRANVIKEAASGEKMKIQGEVTSNVQRRLASDPPVNSELAKWTTRKPCNVFSRASSKSEKVTEFSSNEQLMAADFYGNWVSLSVNGHQGYAK